MRADCAVRLRYCNHRSDAPCEQKGKAKAKANADALGDVVGEDLQAPASVQQLTLAGCHGLTDAGVRELAQRCRNLTELNINVRAVGGVATPLDVIADHKATGGWWLSPGHEPLDQ